MRSRWELAELRAAEACGRVLDMRYIVAHALSRLGTWSANSSLGEVFYVLGSARRCVLHRLLHVSLLGRFELRRALSIVGGGTKKTARRAVRPPRYTTHVCGIGVELMLRRAGEFRPV